MKHSDLFYSDFITKSFRYYRVLYGNYKFSHRSLTSIQLIFLKSLFWIITFTGLKFIFGFILSSILKRIKLNDTICCVYIENEAKIAEYLKASGMNLTLIKFGNIKTKVSDVSFSNIFIFFASLANSYSSYICINNLHKDEILKANTIRIIKSSGLGWIYKHLFLNRELKNCINVNDHSVYNVFLFDLLKQYTKTKLIYIQHSPINSNFPALYHDLNILFSEHSQEKYINDNNKEVFLLFDVRFKQIDLNLNIKEKNIVLLCINDFDDFKIVEKTCFLLKNNGFEVIIRPHPAQIHLFKDKKFEISSIRNIFQDISRSTIVLANETGALLEAIYLKRNVYKCSYWGAEKLDNYNFIEKGLILEEYNNLSDLINAVLNNVCSYDYHKLEYFIGNVSMSNKKIELLKEKLKC